MRFEFDVRDAGWGRAAFDARGTRYEITVSYLTDAPRDLLMSAAALLRGVDRSRVVFVEEPGEVVAIFRSLGGDRLRIQLYRGEDWGRADPARDDPVFAADVSLRRYASQVAEAFARIEREVGIEGYKARWRLYDFPKNALRDLQALLAA